ncbi:beta-glucosidase BglX [Oceanobacillus arenosus]|uniref:Beta-glucosidase BglX n=1 Tax=Oceanobacillus arenosus TaxID=1229153 RepID=A0A3D8Q1N0_9BACI|nr:beta-glucosidase BglX [Oceanobacillus arenosus]RDW21471.1 beta-glucosidase BglX [Oceanobacillus arenosus]
MTDNFLEDLLNQMTLEEKAAQLTQVVGSFMKGSSTSGEITGPMEEMGITEAMIENAGSVLGTTGAAEIKEIQRQHLDKNRLGIPLLFMADVIHGYRTIFPIPLAIGSSWDLKLAEESAAIAAIEAAVSGLQVTFAPMVDIVRDPRWGRVMESTGEDAYLNGEFAKAQVKGYQGKDLKNDLTRVAATVKHFAAYGVPEGGREYNTVNMSERELRETYLPAYKAAIDAGSELVMTSFNTIDGIPATGNKELMRDLLRGEWKFDGVVISDWNAVRELIFHGVAEDDREAAFKAINASVDIEMMSSAYVNHLQALVEEGVIDVELINESVLRVLKLKEKLGLFENPYRGADEQLEKEVILSDSHRQTARELATKSCVLLKNGSALPLKKEQKIALIGPFAGNKDILGSWSALGSKEDAITLSDGMRMQLDGENLLIAEGCAIENGTELELHHALEIANQADVIVLALGESSDMSGEGGSRSNIKLPQIQLDLVEKIAALNKPTVAVIFNGRPLDLHGVVDKVDAVLEAWFPGTEGGAAIADLLFGVANPSGKLSMSFPYSVGQVPVYYNQFNTGRPQVAPDVRERYVSQYLDIPNEPLFPFGFGLSYTTFSYSEMKLSHDVMTLDEPLKISVSVKNTGDVAGDEVVQLYIRDISGEIVRPLKELKGFEKVSLKPGEEKEISFTLTEEQLRYHHKDLTFTSDNGEFIAFIGTNSSDVQSVPFRLEK